MLTHEQATQLMESVGKAMTPEERKALSEYLQHHGNVRRAHLDEPCHCFDHCEDDDEGVPRRYACRKRN